MSLIHNPTDERFEDHSFIGSIKHNKTVVHAFVFKATLIIHVLPTPDQGPPMPTIYCGWAKQYDQTIKGIEIRHAESDELINSCTCD